MSDDLADATWSPVSPSEKWQMLFCLGYCRRCRRDRAMRLLTEDGGSYLECQTCGWRVHVDIVTKDAD